jgi:hypothetical protein
MTGPRPLRDLLPDTQDPNLPESSSRSDHDDGPPAAAAARSEPETPSESSDGEVSADALPGALEAKAHLEALGARQAQRELTARLEAWRAGGFWPRHRDALLLGDGQTRQAILTREGGAQFFARIRPDRFAGLCDAAMRPGSTVVLYGPRGRGKTQLATFLAGHVLVTADLPERPKAIYASWPEIVDLERGVFREEGGKGAIAGLYAPDVVVLDEVQDPGTEFATERLTRVVDRRYGWMRRTILVTSVQGMAELERVIGSSVASRVNETGAFFECAWEGYR